MRLSRILFLTLSFLHPVTGQTSNNPLCPGVKPGSGSKCYIPQDVGCQYRPYTCADSSTVYLSLCSCSSNGIYKCTDSKPPTCKCPSTKPTSGLTGRCTLGTVCRYDPVGCMDGIKFATYCNCVSTKSGMNRYSCTTNVITGQTNDPDCPATPPLNSSCDSSVVSSCNYNPFGCPGGMAGSEFFITKCTCSSADMRFLCAQMSMLPCNWRSVNKFGWVSERDRVRRCICKTNGKRILLNLRIY